MRSQKLFLDQIEMVRKDIYKNDLELALKNLDLCLATISSEQRWKDHFYAIVLMRNGKIEEAIGILATTLQKNGPHLSVILDLAACYYICGQLYNWKQTLAWAQFEWKNTESILQKSQKLKIGLLLAKFMEETGEVSKALEMYQVLLKENLSDHTISKDLIKLKCQLVRMAGQFGIEMQDAQIQYRDLIQHSLLDSSLDHDFEVQHALILFEWQYLGEKSATSRVDRILNGEMSKSYELVWFLSDMIFVATKRKSSWVEEFRIRLNQNPFRKQLNEDAQAFALDAILSQVLSEPEKAFDLYLKFQSHLSDANQLRLLMVLYTELNTTDIGRSKAIILNQISAPSRRIWEMMEKRSSNATSLENEYEAAQKWNVIEINQQEWKLVYNSDSLVIGSNQFQIVHLFLSEQTVSIEAALKQLWNSDLSESSMNRLRMRIYRFNKELEMRFGIKGIFVLTKTHLRSKVQWRELDPFKAAQII